jgi:hypothetical protein
MASGLRYLGRSSSEKSAGHSRRGKRGGEEARTREVRAVVRVRCRRGSRQKQGKEEERRQGAAVATRAERRWVANIWQTSRQAVPGRQRHKPASQLSQSKSKPASTFCEAGKQPLVWSRHCRQSSSHPAHRRLALQPVGWRPWPAGCPPPQPAVQQYKSRSREEWAACC